MIYSYEERVVGKWVDNKPLYEKTLYFDNVTLGVADASSQLKHLVENIDTGIVVSVFYKNSTVSAWSCADYYQADLSTFYNLSWNVGATALRVRCKEFTTLSASADRKYLATIRYTKTTDEPIE